MPTDHASCSYCGLPSDSEFCCIGCRFAASVAQASGEVGQTRWLLTRLGLAIFLSMNVMVFTMFLWSQDGEASPTAGVFYDLARYVCLLFTIPVLLLLGGPLATDAIAELRRGQAAMSLLLSVGVLAAFVYSAVSVVRGGHVYFEVTCMVLVLVTLGRWFEATGKLRTTAALRELEQLLPDEVRVIVVDEERRTPRAAVRPGDLVRVLPGERIPVDGRIDRGRAAVDEQTLTGENVPVCKSVGDLVCSGTLNLDGDLLIAATSTAEAGTLPRLIEAVRLATAIKGRYQRLVNFCSSIFVPVVGLLSLAAFALHWRQHDLGQGLLAGLSVLVIACPCALGLATPMALWVAMGKAARMQIVFRDGDALTKLAQASLVCCDKTGTLTTGEPELERLVSDGETSDDLLLARAVSLAASSTHPFSRAICQRSETRPLPSHDARTLPGLGVTSSASALGSQRLMAETSHAIPSTLAMLPPQSVSYLGWDGRVRGAFVFRDELRPSTPDAIRDLRQLGLQLLLLTGDRRESAEPFAARLQLALRCELRPEDKLETIALLRREGQVVVMLGDGINDAPALAAADIGISLGSGTDISRHSSDICLLSNDLGRLPWLIQLSRQTVRTIRWNLLWAFGYNTLGIAFAFTGWLNPIVAAIAMAVSSLLVVTNSLRLGAAT